jgi:hypothetical protein
MLLGSGDIRNGKINMKSMINIRFVAMACLVGGTVLTARADTPTTTPDKSDFTLFNPTPASAMRDFVTDRPNVTEGPYTVDAGHIQVESSFVEYTHDEDHGVKTDGFSVLPTNFRLGILNNVDLELIVNPYENILTHGKGASDRNSGFGGTQVRTTINFWGNEGDGSTAFGMIPFVTLPTGTDGLSDHHVEGGLILPLDVKLPHDFDFCTEAEFDINHNDKEDDYGVDFVHTACLSHSLFSEKTNGYVEYVGVSPCGTGHTYLAYFDTGLTYLLRENVQLDVGINVGLSDQADDFLVFTGLSFRL